MILLGKIFLIFVIWFLIVLCFLFILNSRKIYRKLKCFEELCIYKRKETVHKFVPFLLNLSELNKNVRMILNLSKTPLKKISALIFSFIFKGLSCFQGLKICLQLSKRLLR